MEERCFQPAGRQPGMPTVGMTVGILLATFLVIGEYNISDSRISVLIFRNISSASWAGLVAVQIATEAIAKNIDYLVGRYCFSTTLYPSLPCWLV